MDTVILPRWAYDKLMEDLEKIASVGENPDLQGEYSHSKMVGYAQAYAYTLLKNLPFAVRQQEIMDEFAAKVAVLDREVA